MKRDILLKIAASSLVFTSVLTGCGPVGNSSVASMSSKPASAKDGVKYAKKAEKAMAKGQLEKAIAYAERSVAGVGDNPETRALLGQAYMAAGRFASAERSFLDAMELGKKDARLVLTLSLAQLGQGKADAAKQVVKENRQYLPIADYGLALALAGDSKAAVDILEMAIRDANVSGRTRQNLGLAYALDGRWKEAKLMAVQDMPAATVDQRMMQWAQMARPGAYQTRVVEMFNVTPAAVDPGQPVRLALNAEPSVFAQSPEQDYSREVASFDGNEPLPAIGPAPVEGSDVDFTAKENNVKVTQVAVPASVVKAPVNKPKVTAAPKPAPVAPATKFVVENEAPQVKSAAATPVPVNTPAAKAIAAARPILQKVAFQPTVKQVTRSSGTHLVQLGAFSSTKGAQRAWGILTAQNSDLAAFQHASSRINVNGKTLYRLAAMGFGNAKSAKAMCDGIKAKGGSCIVRHTKGIKRVAPTQMASNAPKKLASR